MSLAPPLLRRGRLAQLRHRRELLRWEYRSPFRHRTRFRLWNSIAHVQDAALGSTSNGTSQQSSAFGANPTVGNYLVLWAWGWNSGTSSTQPTLSDSATGNTWVVPTNAFQFRASDLWCLTAYAKVANTGAAFKVQVAKPTQWSSGAMMICAAEFSGVASSSPEDGASIGTTNTTGAPAPGSKAITAGSLVAAVMSNNGAGTVTVTTPTGYSRVGVQTDGSFEAGEGCYAINPTTPTNPTWNSSTVPWGAAQFALLAAGGGSFPGDDDEGGIKYYPVYLW